MSGLVDLSGAERFDPSIRGDVTRLFASIERALPSLQRQVPPRRSPAIRTADIVIASLLLFFLAPLMLVVALFIALSTRGPVLFAQRRIGLGGREFGCLKFRTMVVDAEERLKTLLAEDPVARREWQRDHKLRLDPRITPMGRFLRRSSIDELPQLLNVIRGEMSLVGPRPIVQSEICRYGWRFRHYCSVRPGLTGFWQTGGRNDVSYRRRVAMDSKFVKHHSVGLYFLILLRTPACVLTSRGSY